MVNAKIISGMMSDLHRHPIPYWYRARKAKSERVGYKIAILHEISHGMTRDTLIVGKEGGEPLIRILTTNPKP